MVHGFLARQAAKHVIKRAASEALQEFDYKRRRAELRRDVNDFLAGGDIGGLPETMDSLEDLPL